jgi:hypothetical protein
LARIFSANVCFTYFCPLQRGAELLSDPAFIVIRRLVREINILLVFAAFPFVLAGEKMK